MFLKFVGFGFEDSGDSPDGLVRINSLAHNRRCN